VDDTNPQYPIVTTYEQYTLGWSLGREEREGGGVLDPRVPVFYLV